MRDVRGRTIVVTGGSSGVGEAAVRALASEGAKVVFTGRSARTRVVAEETGAEAHVVDYGRLGEVRAFAAALLERHPRIDVLVNNVGAVYGARRLTPDGHEATFQVNHLAGFLLTRLLRHRLEESGAVVVNTASAAHRFGRLDLDDLENERRYNEMRAYGTSKMMNILHAMEIGRRFEGVSAVSFHPGGVATRFGREGSSRLRWAYESWLGRLYLSSPEKGADTLLWLIRGEPGKDWRPGEYYAKRKPARKSPRITPEAAARLWEASERLLSGGAAGSPAG